MERRLINELMAVRRVLRSSQRWRGCALISALALAMSVLLTASDQFVSPKLVALGAILTVSGLVAATLDSNRRYRTLTDVAERIERQFPDLQQKLLTSVTQLTRSEPMTNNPLSEMVVRQSLIHARQSDWTTLTPRSQRWIALATTVASLAIAVPLVWRLASRPYPERSVAPTVARAIPVGVVTSVAVSPGNKSVEKHSPLVISARFEGSVPKESYLCLSKSDGTRQRITLTRRLQDPVFAHYLPQVSEPTKYHVEFADQRSETFQITVFERPDLVQADAYLKYPDYTGLDDREILDTLRVSAVEGSVLTWTAHLNKPVKRAWLEASGGEELAMIADSQNAHAYRLDIPLDEDQTWHLHLVDHDERSNESPTLLSVRVTANRPPRLSLTSAKDVEVSPLQELTIAANAWDDFGMTQCGISYALAATPDVEHVLHQDIAGRQETSLIHLLDFESLQAEPDQMLAFHFWADDNGPDGLPRRTRSEIYFADVRHFDEIFREGQAPPGGQSPSQQSGQNVQQAEELLELQKQIISATWNLIRMEDSADVSETFIDDVQLIVDSQITTGEQASALMDKVRDEQSRKHALEVVKSMMDASAELQRAHDDADPEALKNAIRSEQISYQGLLKLRAREHQVTRSQSQSSGGGSGGNQRRRRQLDELELEQDENRYETERRAATQDQTQQEAENQEMRQILNRLRDLARRQQDVNRQLQELQTALQRDLSKEQREELEQQLRRLRDQQEDLLRDADELDERVNQANNQPELQQTQRQLQESREQLRSSTQAVEQGDVNQALAAGTRAERQFREMSDALREKTANRFSEQMQSLRQNAREIAERQQQLTEQLRPFESSESPGLRQAIPTPEIQTAAERQRKDVDQLLQQMENTVRDAESAEPLLAQKLYDSIRQAARDQIGQNLDLMKQQLESGFVPQAIETQAETTEGVRRLTEGVEEAAESILGSELEGLRRAAGELSELAELLNREASGRQVGNETEANATQDDQANQDANESMTSSNTDAEQRRDGDERPQPSNAGEDPTETINSPDSSDDPGARRPDTADSPSQQGSQSAPSNGRASQPQSPNDSALSEPSGRPNTSSEPSDNSPGQTGDRANGGGQRGAPQAQQDSGGLLQSLGENTGGGPITGASYGPWSDRLRNVEEMLDNPELRSRVSQIRDRARNLRREMKRQSAAPRWSLVEDLIAKPLEELIQQVELELARQSGRRDELVPIDRDPVPNRFGEQVRRYYERLGQGE